MHPIEIEQLRQKHQASNWHFDNLSSYPLKSRIFRAKVRLALKNEKKFQQRNDL